MEWGTELFGPLLQTEEILAEPLAYGNFALTVPTGPGLGVELDMDKIDRFRRDGPNRTVIGPAARERL
jgi:muconate cycloisomerase